MNHFHSDTFQHITLNFLPTKDVITTMRLNKTINSIVQNSSRFDLGKTYSQEPMQFHFYLEQVELPITVEGLKVFLSAPNRNSAIKELNNPYKNVHLHFIDFQKSMSNLCFIIPYKTQLEAVAQGPCILLYKYRPIPIDYDENDPEEEFNFDKKNQIMELVKSK